MNRRTALALGLLAGLSTVLVAQGDPKKVELVTVVGCLTKGSGNAPWMLEKGSAPEPARTAFTTQDELTASQKKPLGNVTYRLLGVTEFGIELHVGHKVQVKGLLIISGNDRSINVTSFQHAAPSCQ